MIRACYSLIEIWACYSLQEITQVYYDSDQWSQWRCTHYLRVHLLNLSRKSTTIRLCSFYLILGNKAMFTSSYFGKNKFTKTRSFKLFWVMNLFWVKFHNLRVLLELQVSKRPSPSIFSYESIICIWPYKVRHSTNNQSNLYESKLVE